MANALPVPSFLVALPRSQGYPKCGRMKYKVNSSIKQRPLVVASWNVRTLQDTGLGARSRSARIASELTGYSICIAALSETRLHKERSLVEMRTSYSFFWSDLPKDSRYMHGVGFAVRTVLLHSAQEPPVSIDVRLMTLRLPLSKYRFATFVSVNSPTLDSSDDVWGHIYDTLFSALRTTKSYC